MKNELFEQWAEMSKNATEPMLRLSEISAQAMERVAQQQMDLARDYLELGARQAKLMDAARDPQKWVAEQGDLAAEFSKKLMSRAEAFLKIATETQNAVASWAETAAKKATTAPSKSS